MTSWKALAEQRQEMLEKQYEALVTWQPNRENIIAQCQPCINFIDRQVTMGPPCQYYLIPITLDTKICPYFATRE